MAAVTGTIAIALIIIRGTSYAMSLARAQRLVATGGSIVSVINKVKGTKPNLRLFRKKDGSPTQAAMKGSNHSAVTNSSEATAFFARVATGRGGLTNTQIDIMQQYARGIYNNPIARKALIASGMSAAAVGLILKDIDNTVEKLNQYPVEPMAMRDSIYQQVPSRDMRQDMPTREEWEQSLQDRNRYVPTERTAKSSIYQQVPQRDLRQQVLTEGDRTRFRPSDEVRTARPSIYQQVRQGIPSQEVVRDTDRTRFRPSNLDDYPEEPVTSRPSMFRDARGNLRQEVPIEGDRTRFRPTATDDYGYPDQPLPSNIYKDVRSNQPRQTMLTFEQWKKAKEGRKYSRISDESRRLADPYAIYKSMYLEDYPEEPAGVIPDEVSKVDPIPEKIKRTPLFPISRSKKEKPRTTNGSPSMAAKYPKAALTNDEIANQFDLLAKLRRDEIQKTGDLTVVWHGKEYGGGRKSEGDSRKLLEDINEYNKGRPRPEDPVMGFVKNVAENISSAAKKFSEGVNKKGGGRVSNRPKSYQTIKITKQYANGGSIRKPKRIK